jgi:hypothetical protein
MVLNPKQNQDVGTYGGGLAAQIWHDSMAPILATEVPVTFPAAGIPLGPAPRPPRRNN